MTSPAPLFSFVFITANRCSLLLEALASVDQLPSTQPYEVVIVDNGSEDGTRGELARHEGRDGAAEHGWPADREVQKWQCPGIIFADD